MLGHALLTAPLILSGYAVAQTSGGNTPAQPGLITVLNPAVENQMVDRLPLSARLDTLEGKTLYMVDIGWGGPEAAYSVFEQIEAWFDANMPGVETVIKRKRGVYEMDDPALWEEIKAKGDAALVGISG
jgi:hypothetical protein